MKATGGNPQVEGRRGESRSQQGQSSRNNSERKNAQSPSSWNHCDSRETSRVSLGAGVPTPEEGWRGWAACSTVLRPILRGG